MSGNTDLCESISQLIGSREKLQENPIFHVDFPIECHTFDPTKIVKKIAELKNFGNSGDQNPGHLVRGKRKKKKKSTK